MLNRATSFLHTGATLGFLAVAFTGSHALAQAPVPAEAFFTAPPITTARLAPDGRSVALGVTGKTGRTQLAVLDVATMQARVISAPADADVDRIEWANEKRLVFTLRDHAVGAGDRHAGDGLYAVDRDGGEARQLISHHYAAVAQRTGVPALDPSHRLAGLALSKDSDEVFVYQSRPVATDQEHVVNLLRLNTRTGRTLSVQRPGNTIYWQIDMKDTPRAAVTRERNQLALHLLQADGNWSKVAEWPVTDGNVAWPFGFGPEGALYVRARQGKDKEAVYRYDDARKAFDAEPILALPDNDVQGGFVYGDKGILGIRYLSDARATAWLDAGIKQVQLQVDKLLPGAVNTVSPAARPQSTVVLVNSYSDRQPGGWYLFDAGTSKLTSLGSTRPNIDARQMGTQDLVRYAARDGLPIPAWLTVPAGMKGKKLPMVVLVHSGPWRRGDAWGWSGAAQFLASRGYAVLEPEYRGSAGWGQAHFEKSLRQWGLTMQDDLADGVRWAVQQGIADPSRVCIGGTDYGGYASLMGLIKDPDLFRCGFTWAAITDIPMLYSVNWSNTVLEHKLYTMPELVGRLDADAAQLKATSPLQQASRLKQPVLLAHGSADGAVPIVHSVRMREALAPSNPNVEWVEYAGEAHGIAVDKNRVDYWTRVERFLDKNLKPPL